MRAGSILAILWGMRNVDLIPSYCAIFVAAVARLRWLALTRISCRRCSHTHLECECKPGWVKVLL